MTDSIRASNSVAKAIGRRGAFRGGHLHFGRAITIAPAAPARAVEVPQIKTLLSLRAGRLMDTPKLIHRHR